MGNMYFEETFRKKRNIEKQVIIPLNKALPLQMSNVFFSYWMGGNFVFREDKNHPHFRYIP
jgi:hypothetical protein